ncbi:MAG: hypothetical protein ABW072_08080 [Sedimenticola sp.]
MTDDSGKWPEIGHVRPEWAVTIKRNEWSRWSGIRNGQLRKVLGEIFHELAGRMGAEILGCSLTANQQNTMINWIATPRFMPLQGLFAQAPYSGSPVEIYRQTRGALGNLPTPYQSESRAIDEQARKERIDHLLNTGSPSDGGGIDNYSPAPMGGGPMNFQQMAMARLGGNMLTPRYTGTDFREIPFEIAKSQQLDTASLMNQGVPLASALANQM